MNAYFANHSQVILTLKADNRGEGGIFSLYALVRRQRKRFGLEQSNVTVEKFPLIVAPVSKIKPKRIYIDEQI